MMHLNRVEKTFDDFNLRISNLDLTKGKIYGLVGHNGAGKSTLLKILAGIIAADRAEIVIDDAAIKGRLDLRKRTAYVADRPVLYDWMTVAEYMSFCVDVGIVARNAMQDVLDCFSVPAAKRIRDLSHGNRSKVGLAAALARETDYILMDEPCSGLDMEARHEVLCQLRCLTSRAVLPRAILISTHSLSDLEEVSDEVIILKKGECVLQSSWLAICSDWLVDPSAVRSRGERLPGGYPDAPLVVNRYAAACHDPKLRPATPLEVFLSLG